MVVLNVDIYHTIILFTVTCVPLLIKHILLIKIIKVAYAGYIFVLLRKYFSGQVSLVHAVGPSVLLFYITLANIPLDNRRKLVQLIQLD